MISKWFIVILVLLFPVASIGQGMLLPYLSGGKYGVAREDGKVIIQPKYEAVITQEGIDLILVKQNNLWGVINTKDEILLPLSIEDEQPARISGRTNHGPEIKNIISRNQFTASSHESFAGAHLYEIHDAAKEVYYYINPFVPLDSYIAFGDLKKLNPYTSKTSNFWSTGLVKVGISPGRINFIDTTGSLILKEDVREGNVVSPFVLAVQNNDKLYALMDTKGNVITPFVYSAISSTSHFEFILAERKSQENSAKTTFSLFDKYGKLLVAEHHKKISVEANYAIIREEGKAQLIDRTGQIVFENLQGTISNAFPRTDIFLFCKNDLNGILSESGEIILPSEFDLLDQTLYGDWLFKKGSSIGVLDNFLRVKWSIDLPDTEPEWNYDAGFIFLKKELGDDIKFGVMDTLGKIILDSEYSFIEAPSGDGLIFAKKDSLNALYNSRGEAIIPLTDSLIHFVSHSQLIDYFEPGAIYYNQKDMMRMKYVQRPPVKVVFKKGKAYLADLSGNPINQMSFEGLQALPDLEVSRALFVGYKENTLKRDLINESGKSILPEGYNVSITGVEYTVGGLVYIYYEPDGELVGGYASKSRVLSGIIDADGNWVIPPDSTLKSILGKEFIQTQVAGSRKITLYDRHGSLIEGGPFSFIPYFSDDEEIPFDRLIVGRPKSWKAFNRLAEKHEKKGIKEFSEKSYAMQLKGCIDHTGQIRIPFQYEDIGEFRYPYTEVKGKNNSGKYFTAIIDTNGIEMIRTEYERLWILYGDSSLIAFRKDDMIGLMDMKGRVLIEPKYLDIEKDSVAKKYILIDSTSTFISNLDEPEQKIRLGPKGSLSFVKRVDFLYSTLNPDVDDKNYFSAFDDEGKLLSSHIGIEIWPLFMNRKLPPGYMSMKDSPNGLPYIVNFRTGVVYKSE